MTTTNFGGWRLSSSDESDDTQQEVGDIPLTSNVNESGLTQDIHNMSVEEYVPLSVRLQAKQEDKTTDKTDIIQEDDLPVFEIPKKTSAREKKSSRYEAEKENRQVKPTSEIRSSLDKPKPKKPASVKPKPSAGGNTNKQEREKEAANRKAMLLNIKALKPEECMKYMICSVSHLIANMFDSIEFMKDLQTDFTPSCCLEYFDTPCVKWKRKVPLFTDEQPQSSSTKTEVNDEQDMLVVIPVLEFVIMVHAYTSNNKKEQTLTSWVKDLQFQNPSFKIHLVCYGLEKYKKDKSKSKNKKNSGIPNVSPEEMEEALVDLQIDCNTSVLYFEKPTALVAMIKQITKAIAESPYKRMKRQDVAFINEIPSVKINLKTGEGMKKLWKQMIQQFHKVSPDMSSTISEKYPTLWSLFEAYEACNGDEDKAEYLLADIACRRGVGTIQTKRRIGPELSKKIYRFLMSHNPDEYLY